MRCPWRGKPTPRRLNCPKLHNSQVCSLAGGLEGLLLGAGMLGAGEQRVPAFLFECSGPELRFANSQVSGQQPVGALGADHTQRASSRPSPCPKSAAAPLSFPTSSRSLSSEQSRTRRVMSTKEEKPTLAGVNVKTRKRNIVVPADPGSFATAIVQIFQVPTQRLLLLLWAHCAAVARPVNNPMMSIITRSTPPPPQHQHQRIHCADALCCCRVPPPHPCNPAGRL